MANKEQQKKGLIASVILLIIFLPLSLGGIFLNITGLHIKKDPENTLKADYFDNKLWFYGSNGELLAKYTCEYGGDAGGHCEKGKTFQIDDKYALEYPLNTKELIVKKDKTTSTTTKEYLDVLDNRYAFIIDNKDTKDNSIKIYDFKLQKTIGIGTYSFITNYGVGYDGNLFIAKDSSGKYGVVKIQDSIVVYLVPFEYDYIGSIDSRNMDDKLQSNTFVALQSGEWKIIDVTGEDVTSITSSITEEIVTYINDSVITYSNGIYHFVNLSNERLINDDCLYIEYINSNYILVLDSNSDFYVLSIFGNTILSEKHHVEADSSGKYNISAYLSSDSSYIEMYYNGNNIENVRT